MMVEKQGTIPPPLSAAALRKLVLEAIDESADTDNPETFHARFGHLDRDLQIDDVIHGLEHSWSFDRPPAFTNSTGNGSTTSQPKTLTAIPF